MSRNVFGWSYPPGVTGREPEITGEGPPCDCCGNDPADCICPECPKCGEAGNPHCYYGDSTGHGLEYSMAQLIGLSRMKIYQLKEELRYEELALIQLQELLKQEENENEESRQKQA